MTRQELEINHEKGAKALEAALDAGKNVVFLTLGDPTIYSTFTYVQKRVEADGYETGLVSGITSFCATAATPEYPAYRVESATYMYSRQYTVWTVNWISRVPMC